MTVRASTVALIERSHDRSAIYRGYLASHLPMALAALDEMGAPEARIAAYAARHSSHLEPLGEAERASAAAWLEALQATGTVATLRRALARLSAAPGSGAFHGLIRTAYAIESGSAAELAHALAYWEIAFEPLGEARAASGRATPAEVLAAIAAAPPRARLSGRNIAERMRSASEQPDFEAQVAAAGAASLTLDALAGAALRAYAASGDFTLLHAVTGCQAARTVAPYAPDAQALVAHSWRAVVAAFLACGAPRFDTPAFAEETAARWPDLLARGCDAEDEHDIKLVHAAWREWRRTGDDLYRRAAAARLAPAHATTP